MDDSHVTAIIAAILLAGETVAQQQAGAARSIPDNEDLVETARELLRLSGSESEREVTPSIYLDRDLAEQLIEGLRKSDEVVKMHSQDVT